MDFSIGCSFFPVWVDFHSFGWFEVGFVSFLYDRKRKEEKRAFVLKNRRTMLGQKFSLGFVFVLVVLRKKQLEIFYY